MELIREADRVSERNNLIIENPTINKLLQYMNSRIEIGGNFKYNDGYLTLGPTYSGDRFHVVFDQTVSAFNFHTHPTEPTILNSFYSQGDIIAGLRRQSVSDKIRKDILVTEDGLFSLQLSPKLMTLYRKFPDQIEFLLGFYQRYVVQPKMNPKGDGVELKEFKDLEKWNTLRAQYACNVLDMVNMLNNLTGLSLYEWMIDEIDKGTISFRDKFQLASYLSIKSELLRIGLLYYVYFMPWDKKRFEDTFKFV